MKVAAQTAAHNLILLYCKDTFFYIMHPSGTYVAYGIRLYSVLIKILALIFELKSKYLIHFEQPDAMVINCNC
jgi:hypothetical protein